MDIVAVDQQRLGDEVTDPHARVHGAVRILEHRLNRRTVGAHLLLAQLLNVFVLPEDTPLAGRLDLEDRTGGGGFAAARLADETEGLTLFNVERDSVHRSDQQRLTLEKRATSHRKKNVQVLHLEDLVIIVAVRER